MATYAELSSAEQDGTLYTQVLVACWIAANTIMAEVNTTTNHANRLLWAKQVYYDPENTAHRMLRAVLAANQASTLAQIQGATDAQVQTAVTAAVDLFANGQP